MLLTESGIPPRFLSMGSVVRVKLGHDGLARVAVVRTSRGLFKKPITTLTQLSVKDSDVQTAIDARHVYKEYQHERQLNCVPRFSG